MTIIRATATVTYEYDTADGLVANTDEACIDAHQHISSGVNPNDFTITATETETETPVLPLPTESFGGGTVIASVWIRDDEDPITAMLLVLMPEPGMYYRVFDIEWRTRWEITQRREHINIVPAVRDYENNGGDY